MYTRVSRFPRFEGRGGFGKWFFANASPYPIRLTIAFLRPPFDPDLINAV